MKHMMKQHLKLCLLTHPTNQTWDEYRTFIHQAIDGGVTCVQLRNKNQEIEEKYRFCCLLQEQLVVKNIPLIINDDINLAKRVHADGLHLGQTDGDPLEAREQLGPNVWIGRSIESLNDLMVANQCDAIDYVAASAVFQSQTKSDCKTFWGIDGLKNMVHHSTHPVVAIGGINTQNVASVWATGVAGIAVIGALHNSNHPQKAAYELRSGHYANDC